MSRLTPVFDVFSRRNPRTSDVPKTTRTRVVLWCKELFDEDCRQFFEQIRKRLQLRLGRILLSKVNQDGRAWMMVGRPWTDEDEVRAYLNECPGKEFLDFLEDIFRVEVKSPAGSDLTTPGEEAVEELNDLLRLDGLPYHVAGFVWPSPPPPAEGPNYSLQAPAYGPRRPITYPTVIMRESEILHTEAIVPVLELLADPAYENANKEYREALEDYRKGDLGDCLTKCGSALESVLIILCDRNGWSYPKNATAKKLIEILLSNTTLESYFEQMLLIVATLRNKLSTAHGAGTSPRSVARHRAHYALNATAAAILLVTEEAKVAPSSS